MSAGRSELCSQCVQLGGELVRALNRLCRLIIGTLMRLAGVTHLKHDMLLYAFQPFSCPHQLGSQLRSFGSIGFEAVELPAKGYRFTISINSDQCTKKLIDRVDDTIDHPTFKVKPYTSTDARSNDSMSYVGWGAVDEVNATVKLKDGTVQNATINIIRELGW